MQVLKKNLLSALAFLAAIGGSFAFSTMGWHDTYTAGGSLVTVQINRPAECSIQGLNLCTVAVENPITLEIESQVVFQEPGKVTPFRKN